MKLEDKIYEIVEKAKEKKLYIYGGGVWGQRIQRFLQCIGREIDGIIDKNRNVGEGCKVYSSEQIKQWEKRSFFIVVSSGLEEIIKEIKADLSIKGLVEESDYTIFNKFVEQKEGIKDINDYFFGHSRMYISGGGTRFCNI